MACGNRRAFLSGRFRPPAKPPASGREGPALPPAAGFCPEMSLETAINKCAARCRPSFPPNRFSESGTLRKEDGIGTLLSESPRPGHGKLANIAVRKSFHCTIRRTGYAIFRLRKTLFFGKSGGPGIIRDCSQPVKGAKRGTPAKAKSLSGLPGHPPQREGIRLFRFFTDGVGHFLELHSPRCLDQNEGVGEQVGF